MYTWRKLTSSQREETLRFRRQCRAPWHSPPHFTSDRPSYYHLTAANYEHAQIIGKTPARLAEFEATLLDALSTCMEEVRAWCVLPNHWRALAKVTDLRAAIKALGQLNGRTSRAWNQEDHMPGRKCWHGCADRRIRSEAHFWATVNYIHHNPVHHGYVKKWPDWPFSSAADWLERIGHAEAKKIWKAYPILEYGKGWDDAEK